MSRSAYLEEAVELAAEIPRNRCPATDAIEYLDGRPHLRLALEDTWTDNAGRVYRQVPADVVSRWPAHIARTFRPFLRISKEPDHVFQLLDLLHALDAGPEVVGVTLTGCRRRKSLLQAIEYFNRLNDELAEVTHERPAEEITVGTLEPRCRPRFSSDEVEAGTWHLQEYSTESENEEHIPPCWRAEIIHDPTAARGAGADWLTRQPRAFRRLYCTLKRAKASTLPTLRKRLLKLSVASSGQSHGRLEVLWDTYRIRRDYLRRQQQQHDRHRLNITARKLVRRVRRINSKAELGHVGKSLYLAMQGNISLPGPVSQPEWAVVFANYRARRSALLGSTC